MRHDAIAAAGKGSGKRKKKGKGNGDRSFGDPVYGESPTGSLTQAEAKRFIPLGASIWFGYTKSIWCGHCPLDSGISEPWTEFGDSHHAAAIAIIKELWSQYLELEGFEDSDCLVAGLL